MVEAWVVEGLHDGFVTGSPGFLENSRKSSQTVCHSFPMVRFFDVLLVSLERRSGEYGLRSLLTSV